METKELYDMPLSCVSESGWEADHLPDDSSGLHSASVALSLAAIERRSQLLFNSMRNMQ